MKRGLRCTICSRPQKSQPDGMDVWKPPNGPIKRFMVVHLCEECYGAVNKYQKRLG